MFTLNAVFLINKVRSSY